MAKANQRFFPVLGAERLVRHLHEHNIPIALATSSGTDSVEVKTKNHQEVFNLFHHKVMGSSDAEVKEGKPAPDIFLVAASRFPDKPSPDQVGFVDFLSYGMEKHLTHFQ